MASRYYNQFIQTFNRYPVYMDGSFMVGVAGAVVPNSIVGTGIFPSSTLGIAQLGAGIYEMRFQDDFNRLLGLTFMIEPPLDQRALPDGSSALVLGRAFRIINASTSTNWYQWGLSRWLTPSSGVAFVPTTGATNTPGSSTPVVGSGTIARLGNSGLDAVEVVGPPNLTMWSSSASSGIGGARVLFQTIVSSSGAPVNATSGTVIRWNVVFRNSDQVGYNEQFGNG